MTSKFKVGDRVRLTGENWDPHDGVPARGEIVEITRIDTTGTPWFQAQGEDWYLYDSGYEAELVTAADENQDASRGYTGTTGDPAGTVHAGCYVPLAEGPKHVGQDFGTWQDILDIALLGKKLGVEKADDFVASVGEFDNPVDPDHYKFPGGIEVRQISAHLTSFGGQAVQYVARSTRLDGKNKGDRVENLKKAQRMIDWEIERLEAAE